jgi:hypothetical protein
LICLSPFVAGEWQWLVRRRGGDVAEGAARGCRAAKQQAEAAAQRVLDIFEKWDSGTAFGVAMIAAGFPRYGSPAR